MIKLRNYKCDHNLQLNAPTRARRSVPKQAGCPIHGTLFGHVLTDGTRAARAEAIFAECAFSYRALYNILLLLTQRVDLGCVGVYNPGQPADLSQQKQYKGQVFDRTWCTGLFFACEDGLGTKLSQEMVKQQVRPEAIYSTEYRCCY